MTDQPTPREVNYPIPRHNPECEEDHNTPRAPESCAICGGDDWYRCGRHANPTEHCSTCNNTRPAESGASVVRPAPEPTAPDDLRERVRAALRLISPEHITPMGRRQIERVLDDDR